MDNNMTAFPHSPFRPPQLDTTLRLAQLTQLLRHNLWLIALCAIVAAGAAVAYVHTLPKIYTASGLLAIQGDQFAIPQLRGALRDDNSPDPMPAIHTEVQALSSYALVAQVVAKLKLSDNPEFNPALRPPSLVERGKDFIGRLVSRVLPQAPATNGVDDGPSIQPVVNSAERALSIFQDNRSLAIALGFTSRDPELAARFVNTLIQSYVATRTNRRDTANADANTTLTLRVDKARADLQQVEQQMATLRSQGDVVGVRAGSVGQQQVEELTTAAARASFDRSQLELNYGRASAAAKSGSADAIASVLTSPTIAQLRERVAAASQRQAELSTHVGADHPSMRAASAQLAAAQAQVHAETSRIVDSLGAQLRVAREQEADTKRQLDAARHQAVNAENAHAQLEQLQQEATTRRALYQSLLESEQQTVARPANGETPDIRVLNPAVAPAFPSGPNLKIAGVMGGAGGTLLGCFLALVRRSSVRRLESAEDLSSITGLNVLATLPRHLVRSGTGLLARRDLTGVTHGRDAEAMRMIRNQLRFAGPTKMPRCILFMPASATSPKPSLVAPVAACFARAAAAAGQQVLLVEADLYDAPLAEQLGLKALPAGMRGMHTVLAGQDWRAAITADRIAGLDLLLDTGAKGQRPQLDGAPLHNLLVEAQSEYDLVVLNGPSPDATDALVLVQRADIAVIVVDGRLDRDVGYKAVMQVTPTRTPLAALLIRRS